ncbi:hypothetical protein [Cupriavidus sp. TMH.W2]|uniref:hypothetical protein n=1 Tax=Cupriavidus sp. TMH.W2 TaxID=3434465 RepID=UPI003D780B94
MVRINQGRHDTEEELLGLKENAERLGRADALDAVHQRLRLVAPNVYQRLVGPLRARIRDKRFQCYCNNPKSLHAICSDILADAVHSHALTCDACWQEDLAKTWGYYGWAAKTISQQKWNELCQQRAYFKFVE